VASDRDGLSKRTLLHGVWMASMLCQFVVMKICMFLSVSSLS
jgi:hypothetical protein